jgi:two-component system LytT family response regulator
MLKTNKGERHVINYALEEIEGFIDNKKFFRANRQFVLNVKNIKEVHHWFNGKLKVTTNPIAETEIIISRERAADFKKWMGE